MYNLGRILGVVSGVLIGLVIAVIVLRFVNKNKKMTAEYDEMQKLVRGRGYMYSFYTVLIYEALMCVLSMGVELPAVGNLPPFMIPPHQPHIRLQRRVAQRIQLPAVFKPPDRRLRQPYGLRSHPIMNYEL